MEIQNTRIESEGSASFFLGNLLIQVLILYSTCTRNQGYDFVFLNPYSIKKKNNYLECL
jgi:hypothetical protein